MLPSDLVKSAAIGVQALSMAHHFRGFGMSCPARPSPDSYRWGPSLPALPRATSAANSAASGPWERPLTTRSIQLDSQTTVAVSVAGEELSQEDLLGLLEDAAAQLRASLQPRARIAA